MSQTSTLFSSRFPLAVLAVHLLATAAVHAEGTNEWGVGSTNLDKLPRFWRSIEASNGPVTLLGFGDSMAVSYRSIQTSLFGYLQQKFGYAGLAFADRFTEIGPLFDGGAAWSDPKTNTAPLWWMDYVQIPTGGAAWWVRSVSAPAPIACDQVGLFWVAHPGGGQFALSLSTNAGAWSGAIAIIDGYAASPVSRYTNFNLPSASYWLRATGIAGDNFILSPQFLTRSSTGVASAFISKNGANLNELFSISTNITYPIISALNPRLVLWHGKELADLGETGLSNRLVDLEVLWRSCVPDGEVVYVGTPHEYRDTYIPLWTPTQNRLVKEAAVRGGFGYVDCMTPCHSSYWWQASAGLMDDWMHFSTKGSAFIADVAWREMTLSALRVDRSLAIHHAVTGGQVLSWPTVTGLNYELQTTSDLQNWSSLLTTNGTGGTQSFTNSPPDSAQRLFRLKLTGI